MRSRARSADFDGQCSAADKSRLAKAAERQGGEEAPPPVRGDRTM